MKYVNVIGVAKGAYVTHVGGCLPTEDNTEYGQQDANNDVGIKMQLNSILRVKQCL